MRDQIDLRLLFAVSGLTVVVGQPLLTLEPLAKVNRFEAVPVGFVLLGLGFAFNGQATSSPGFVGATVLWSIGDLVRLGRAYAVVALIAPAASLGRYMSVHGISRGVAAMVGPLFGTQLLEQARIGGTWYVLAFRAHHDRRRCVLPCGCLTSRRDRCGDAGDP